ncbi:sensor histidine kinase [Paenibacillus antarcticus]|uniref:histidine kinase n=1 Tax=Paenibacillus antarcticus TaxID=253703 RepID=A0A162QF71_9BACL|nr:sensor histidine kinase [Paenibacillus antarcticus]OAB48020.1 two-component sensor histidine kinase [Paenibacillus antarcticus]
MLKKIYPADQIEKYLFIDLIAVIFLIYRVVMSEWAIHFAVKLLFIALFVACYYIGLWHRDWRLLVGSLVGCLLIVALSMYVDSWLLLYGFVFANLLGRAYHKWIISVGMAGIIVMFMVFCWINEGSPIGMFTPTYFPTLIAQLVTPIVIYTRTKANFLKEKLDIANAQLERYIQEEERSRIARDLHDTLGQTLTMIKLKSELTLRLVDKNPEKAKDELNDIVNTSRLALQQVRELVTDMKFISLAKEYELSRDICHKAGIELIVNNKESRSLLTNVAETMLALSVRESITNIIKHSEAKHCTISQLEQDEYYHIQVSDDGNGNLMEGQGNGIQSIRERMALLQGEVHIVAYPNNGTAITLKVPLMRNRKVK